MKAPIKTVFILLIVLIGIVSVSLNTNGQYYSIFAEFRIFPFIALIIITIVAIRLEWNSFKSIKKIHSIISSSIGLVFICIVSVQKIETYYLEKLKTLIEITHIPGSNNVLKFELKETGKLKLTETDIFGTWISYGEYSKTGSKVVIQKLKFNNINLGMPIEGNIKQNFIQWDNFDKMIVTDLGKIK